MSHAQQRRTSRLALVAGTATAFAVGLSAPAMAASPTTVANDALTIRGTSGDDRIVLRLALGAPGTLEIDFGDDGTAEHSFDRSTFSAIEVFASSGRDQFRIDQANGTFIDEAITVNGGSGNDNLNGGDGAETFVGGSGNDAVDGNRGDDVGVLGSGNDSFKWDPGDGSDIVEGQSGTDTLDFNGANVAEIMSLSAEGERSVFLRNVANIRMDMDGVERLDLTALGGVDTMTVNDMSGTDFRVADVDLSGATGSGYGANDIVAVNGTTQDDDVAVAANGGAVDVSGLKAQTRILGSEATDQLQVNTLDGNDTVDVDPAAAALIGVTVDLGPGQG
jgi:hypothetical protein